MKQADVRSVIQWNFQSLLDTGMYAIHHVFPGKNRRICEKHGFLVAVLPSQHDEAHADINGGQSLRWKQECQRWYENNIGDRAGFVSEFGRSYL